MKVMKGLEWLAQIRLLFKLIALSVQVVQWNQRTHYFNSIAIRVLEQQGLVEVIPKDGTYVTSFDSDQIKDGLHVRVALEQLALKQSTLNASRILSGGSIVSISRIWLIKC